MKQKKQVLLSKLNEIHQTKIRIGVPLKKDELSLFDSWVVRYTSAPIAQVILGIPEKPESRFKFDALPLLSSSELYCMIDAESKRQLPYLNKMRVRDESMTDSIRLMSSPFALLPGGLNDFQLRQLWQYHFQMMYSAAYIIREGYSKNLARLPRCDNKIKPYLNAWADPWLRIANLCLRCRDLLSEQERAQFPRSWDWLDSILEEDRRKEIMKLKGDVPLVPTKESVEYWREYARVLERGDIPVDPSVQPSRCRLLELGLEFAHKETNAYIASIRRYARERDCNENVRATGFHEGVILREWRGSQKKKKNGLS